MTEKPTDPWTGAAPLEEIELRMAAIARQRVLDLPTADKKAIRAAKHPQTMVRNTADPGVIELFVALDDGVEVGLGRVHRAVFAEDPPSLS
jgi:hypothetical protein